MRTRVTDLEITFALRWLVVGLASVGAATILGILVAVDLDLLDVDVWWNSVVRATAPVLQPLSLVLDVVGRGWISILLVPLGGAVLLVIARRPWSGLYFVAASAASVAVVQLLKAIFGRARPEEILVAADYGSFPSGHTANAATIAAVAVVLFPRLWVAVVAAGCVLLMAFSRTQVHAHWLSDTVGGTLVGIGMALVVAAAFAVPILRERDAAHGP